MLRGRVSVVVMWRDLQCNEGQASLRLCCVTALARAGATLWRVENLDPVRQLRIVELFLFDPSYQ